MRNTIKYISNTEAEVTKAFAKRAAIFGTPEFDEWRRYKAIYSDAEMITKTRTNKSNSIDTRNLTYANMEIFICEQDNSKKLLAEFNKVKKISCVQTSPYRAVLAWFLKTFKDYDRYKEFFENISEENRKAGKETENTAE